MQPKYFKVTNATETHAELNYYWHGHPFPEDYITYHDGLNILDESKFDFYRKDEIFAGLSFVELDDVPKFYWQGINLREVYLTDDENFKMGKCNYYNVEVYRATRIILGKKHSLMDPETYKLFGLDITKNKFLVNFAAEYGDMNFFNWWSDNMHLKLEYTHRAMVGASTNGHIEVLEWFKNSGLEYSFAMVDASNHGHIHVLDWWKNSGLQLRYNDVVLQDASRDGRIDILNWWINSGLDLKYEKQYVNWAITSASYQGHVDVLDWWVKLASNNPNVKLTYDKHAIDLASQRGHIHILDWWLNSGLKLKYSRHAINDASPKARIWWENNGLK